MYILFFPKQLWIKGKTQGKGIYKICFLNEVSSLRTRQWRHKKEARRDRQVDRCTWAEVREGQPKPRGSGFLSRWVLCTHFSLDQTLLPWSSPWVTLGLNFLVQKGKFGAKWHQRYRSTPNFWYFFTSYWECLFPCYEWPCYFKYLILLNKLCSPTAPVLSNAEQSILTPWLILQ